MTDRDRAIDLVEMADLVRPNAIRAAATLGLADHIAAGAGTAAELAARTRTDPRVLAALLRYLAELGVLDGRPDSHHDIHYSLTERGEPLRTDAPVPVARHLSSESMHGRAALGLVGLGHTLRTGGPAFDAVFGRSFWDDVNTDPACTAALRDEGLQEIAFDANLVVEDYDWSRVRHVTDVGGNNGTLLIALLAAHPHLSGTVLDLPNLAAIAGERIADAGLADRGDARAGSFFDPLPDTSDVYLLSGILGDWQDDDAVRILTRCREAIGATGRLLVADISLTIPVSDLDTASYDLFAAATVPAPSRDADELDALFARAGLDVTWRGPSTAVRSLVELAASPVAAHAVPAAAGGC